MENGNVIKTNITLNLSEYTRLVEEVTEMEVKMKVVKDVLEHKDDREIPKILKALFNID